ncbi:hypothetical protein B0T24DRAFT_71994 [Lasiosphaeria ovina]|uniref:Uncharacterized protein n=1 Tax=Lasiosphaeria ovina TaxID=92902 RepID=A0AAE0NMD2_9PEZI|nr:hypothetical protein B0T24DRAFT_71994 [Lasiosphaeria ovina]
MERQGERQDTKDRNGSSRSPVEKKKAFFPWATGCLLLPRHWTSEGDQKEAVESQRRQQPGAKRRQPHHRHGMGLGESGAALHFLPATKNRLSAHHSVRANHGLSGPFDPLWPGLGVCTCTCPLSLPWIAPSGCGRAGLEVRSGRGAQQLSTPPVISLLSLSVGLSMPTGRDGREWTPYPFSMHGSSARRRRAYWRRPERRKLMNILNVWVQLCPSHCICWCQEPVTNS